MRFCVAPQLSIAACDNNLILRVKLVPPDYIFVALDEGLPSEPRRPRRNESRKRRCMAIAFTFPGQGSQTVGMGKELADAFPESARVFEQVDEALGQNLSKLIWEGPEDELTLTANAQPALMAVSMAALRAMEARGVVLAQKADFLAGHSLGEYSALCARWANSVPTLARSATSRSAAALLLPQGKGMDCRETKCENIRASGHCPSEDYRHDHQRRPPSVDCSRDRGSGHLAAGSAGQSIRQRDKICGQRSPRHQL